MILNIVTFIQRKYFHTICRVQSVNSKKNWVTVSQMKYGFSHDLARDLRFLEGRGRLGLVFLEYLAVGFFSDCMYSSLVLFFNKITLVSEATASFIGFRWELKFWLSKLIKEGAWSGCHTWKMVAGLYNSCGFQSHFLLPATVSGWDSGSSRASIIPELKKVKVEVAL